MIIVLCLLIGAGFSIGDAYVLRMNGRLSWRESWIRALVTWEISYGVVAIVLALIGSPNAVWTYVISLLVGLPTLWVLQWFLVRKPIRRAQAERA